MNKKVRQERKQLKYEKRIRRFVASVTLYVNREGEYIYYPTTQYIMRDNGQLAYKTCSTPCSCWGCSGEYKYKRHEQKKIEMRLIQEGLDEFLNP